MVAIKHHQRGTPFLNGDVTYNIIKELTDIFQTDTAPQRVPVKATPHGAPRVPTHTVASHGSPRVPIRKLFVPHKLGHTIYKPFVNLIIELLLPNGSTKAKLSNMMPVKNYTKSSMRMGMQKNCPMKKYLNIQKSQLIHRQHDSNG